MSVIVFESKIGQHNAEFDKIVQQLSEITDNGQSARLTSVLDYGKLFPSNLNILSFMCILFCIFLRLHVAFT